MVIEEEEIFQFQAETKHLLDLMIHSLYTNKEIFLRELISNASDALDRLRFEAIMRPEMMEHDSKLEIHLEADPKARTLTISDNGIGMSRQEVIDNIGTIAKSGTRDLREKIKEGASDEILNDLIGQFGVGFYSSFMIADKVTLLTRRAVEEPATYWESTGNGEYIITEASKPQRGTSITLHLRPIDLENGIEDFTDKWILARTIKRYSDFVSYPIVYKDEREEVVTQEGPAVEEGQKKIVVEDKILNSMKPIWVRPQSEVTDDEYAEFYKHFFYDTEAPWTTIAAKAEGRLEYQALLFIPSKAPRELFYHAFESGLRLHAKGVLIIEKCADLVPRYLRFIKGVVDSADLPLNISRQMLQQERQIKQIQKWLTKKVLETLRNIHENDPAKYLSFWQQFGRALKEGVSSDFDNKNELVSLLLFASSADPEKLTSLKDYVGRMKEDQKEIFYLAGESRSVVENSPHLEAFNDKGYEVLYLVDPVDELVVQFLTEFDGKQLKSIGKGTVKLGSEEDSAREAEEIRKKQEEAAELLQFLQQSLDQYVKDVRLTNRLRTSPVCLVGSEIDYSPQMERLLQMGKGVGPRQRRIMELNPRHPIFTKMLARFQRQKDDAMLVKYAHLLLGYGLIAEGSELFDPVEFNRLVAELMEQSS
jgi:molecular chaperone HtpG